MTGPGNESSAGGQNVNGNDPGRTTERAGLARGALGFPTVLMQGVAQIAPAFGVVASIAFNTQLAGLGAPSTFLAAFIIALMVAVTIGQLAKHLPSAGGLGTYVSASVGPSAGFVVGWLYSWLAATATGAAASYTGYIMQTTISSEYRIDIGWQYWAAAVLALTAFVAYRGIRVSGRALLVFSVAEMLILIALSVSSLVSPGPGGLRFSGLNPGSSTSLNGFYLAVIFSIFAFTGWEGAAAVAEEARRPRWAIPRAMAGAVIVFGIFIVFCAWAIQIGWGTNHLSSLVTSVDNPVFVVAHRLWGAAWIIVLLALLNSGIAVSIAAATDSSRMWYSMSRARTLPRYLGHIHASRQTPSFAVLTQTGIAALVAFGAGTWIGPGQVLYFFGVAATVVYVLVYVAANIGVVHIYHTSFRRERNWLLHAVFPAASSAVLVWVAWKSLYPLPAGPDRYAPLASAILLAAGIAITVALHLRPDAAAWKERVRQVFQDRPETGIPAATQPGRRPDTLLPGETTP